MFASYRQIRERLLDAADLIIDFATLGEYGLEPVESEAPRCTQPPCPRRSQTAPRPARQQHLPAAIS